MTHDKARQPSRPSLDVPAVARRFSYLATLRAAGGALLILICLSGFLSHYIAEESKYYHQRRGLADKVLEAHLDLSTLINQRFTEIAHAAFVEPEDKGYRATVPASRTLEDLDRIRELITDEVRHVGETENEVEEIVSFDRLDAIVGVVNSEIEAVWGLVAAGDRGAARIRLAGIFKQKFDEQLQQLIDDAITEERRDVARANTAAATLIQRFEIYSSTTTILVFVLSAIIFIALLRRLRFSLATLSEGADAIAGGRLDYRIPELGDEDFDALGQQFNRMAGDLKSDRQKLLTAQASLENTVAERTRQLELANKRLEELDRTRRRFLADVAHELRTPLTVIRGEGEIALRGKNKESSAYRMSLQRIVEQTGHTANLLDDLLFMVRADQGQVRLATRHVPLAKILEDAVRAFETVAAERKVSIQLQLDVPDAVVAGDRIRLRQTFIALIDNALHHSEPGGEVRVRLTKGPGHFVVLVEDNGIGIPEDELDLVFERFYRGDNAIRRAEGTGLGLPVAKAIVEAHGGRITLENKAGKGMAATITLPSVGEQKAGGYPPSI